ncbi:hypothetical protein [Streptomyces sp. NPDC003952]
MTDRRPTALRLTACLPLRPASLGPRLLTEALDVVARRVRTGRSAGASAVCAAASGYRSRPDPQGGSAGGSSVLAGRRSTLPGATDPHQGAREVIESRTTSPGDLASLLEMLGLEPTEEPLGNRGRSENDRGHPGPR